MDSTACCAEAATHYQANWLGYPLIHSQQHGSVVSLGPPKLSCASHSDIILDGWESTYVRATVCVQLCACALIVCVCVCATNFCVLYRQGQSIGQGPGSKI
jgi:hypothetical protein